METTGKVYKERRRCWRLPLAPPVSVRTGPLVTTEAGKPKAKDLLWEVLLVSG